MGATELKPRGPLVALSLFLAALGLWAPAQSLSGQDVVRGPLPQEVQERILELANAPATMRVQGNTRIPPGGTVQGDLMVLGGDLELGGWIQGELMVVNGSLELADGARVDGSVLVVGGQASGVDAASLGGPALVYPAPLHYRIRGGRLEGIDESGRIPTHFLDTDLGFGRSRVTVRAAGPYNRVEGLPVQFGPLLTTGGSNPLSVEAFGIWRSEAGLSFDTERMGYQFTADQAVGGRGTMSAGLTAYSRVEPIETRGISNLETSLATFFMRRDYRDYYEAQGWSAYLELRPIRLPVRLRAAFREEEHAFIAEGGPWTLGDGDDPWRPLAAVGEGRGRFLEASVLWDSRNDPDHPSDGWWTEVRATQQVGGRLRTTFHPTSGVRLDPDEGRPFSRLTWASADIRRYARVSPSTNLKLRVHGAGSLGSSPLPPQFQSALGGEGSLPGHPRFAVDCGAREMETVDAAASDEEAGRPAFAAYGCDRVSLAQVEVQQALPLVWDPLSEERAGSEWAGLLRIQPTLSVFVNAGRGWARNAEGFAQRPDAPLRGDIGVGLATGSVGLYWAYPLNRKEQELNFFVRLSHRF